MTIATRHRIHGRTLIPEPLFARLVERIITEEELDQGLAQRIMDQALAFLGACGHNRGDPLAPSELVDIGWHAFILHTHDYAAFCDQVAGRFLHHIPTEPGTDGDVARATLVHTVTAIKRAGFVVDTDLWPAAGACTGCHNGCHDDPPPLPAG